MRRKSKGRESAERRAQIMQRVASSLDDVDQIRDLTRGAAERERELHDAIAKLERDNRMLREENETLRLHVGRPPPALPPGTYRAPRAPQSSSFALPKWKHPRKESA